MIYEITWLGDDGVHYRFRTSCPYIAEVFFRSESGFPPLCSAAKQEFDGLYGNKKGRFAEKLVSARKRIAEIDIGIIDVTVRRTNNRGM